MLCYTMIIVITYTELSKRTGLKEVIASHGVDIDTGKLIILPQESTQQIGARFDANIGEYVLPSRA